MNIGLLNDMVASNSKVGDLALDDDEVGAKYISAPETNLVKNELHLVKSLQRMHHISNHALGIFTFVLFSLF